MIRILKSKKGMTITEVILALAILGIVSIPLMAVFSNSVFLTQYTKRQMEINAVMQIVRGEVTQSVKNKSEIPNSGGVILSPNAMPRNTLYDSLNNETAFLAIEGGNLIDTYKYKVQFVDYEEAELAPNIVKLVIKLYNSKNGKLLGKRNIEILY